MEKQDSSKLKLYYQSYTVKFQFTLQSVESSALQNTKRTRPSKFVWKSVDAVTPVKPVL